MSDMLDLIKYRPLNAAKKYPRRGRFSDDDEWRNLDRLFLLNFLAKKYNYTSYLEIGCRWDTTFSRIRIPHKIGVDPAEGGTFRGTSDQFFDQNREKFDAVFIDGLHERKAVLRDVKNSLRILNPNGTIVLHDCLPANEEAARFPYPGASTAAFWNGTVYQAVAELRTVLDIDMVTLDSDWGLGVVRKRPNTDILESLPSSPLAFDDYVKHFDRIMRPVDSLAALMEWLRIE